jgi:lipase chaperone LimK
MFSVAHGVAQRFASMDRGHAGFEHRRQSAFFECRAMIKGSSEL